MSKKKDIKATKQENGSLLFALFTAYCKLHNQIAFITVSGTHLYIAVIFRLRFFGLTLGSCMVAQDRWISV